jgi:hypothetical protein
VAEGNSAPTVEAAIVIGFVFLPNYGIIARASPAKTGEAHWSPTCAEDTEPQRNAMSNGIGKRLRRSDDWYEESNSCCGDSGGRARGPAGLRQRQTAFTHRTYGYPDQNTKANIYDNLYTHDDAATHRNAAADRHGDADASGHQHADRLHRHAYAAAHRHTNTASHASAAHQHTQAHGQTQAEGNEYTQATNATARNAQTTVPVDR